MKQKTIKKEVCFNGVGVHSGIESSIILKPSQINSGIIFVNVAFPMENIKIGKVIPEVAMHASVIKNSKWFISTIEHLMSAVSALGVDNLIIEVKMPEIPILDGSALSFIDGIKEVGLEEQEELKKFLTPIKEIKFEDKEGRFLQIEPARCNKNLEFDKNLYFEYQADFEHPLIGKSCLNGVLSEVFFIEQIAPARTFGFLEKLPFLRKHGLAKGTTLGNTVVIGEEEFLNERRFEDEFIRHKVLDLFGDLALLGKNLAGKIIAKKTGHSFNRLAVEHYIKNPGMWKLIS